MRLSLSAGGGASPPSTLDSVGQWPNSTLIKGTVANFVAELRQQDGGTIGTAAVRRWSGR